MDIVLSSQGYHVTINTLGAELKSYRDPSDREYVWNSDPTYWMRSSPLLFPTIGNVRDNKTQFSGTEYPMAKHGFCKEIEFTVKDQTADSAVFVLTASDETKKSYPFEFELQLKYQLNGSSLSMTYTVFNHDTKEMYYQIGAHPGFMCPLAEGEALTDYVLEFEKEERLESVVYNLKNLCFDHANRRLFAEHSKRLPLTLEMFDDDAVFFPHTASHAVSLVNPATGRGIHMEYPDFVSIAFWTVSGGQAPFLCLEPWNGAAIYDDEDNEFCHKRDVTVLMPASSNIYHLNISLLGC